MDLPLLPEIDIVSADAARRRQNVLTKPPGSLGRLEEIAVAVCGMQGTALPVIEDSFVVVAAADHGVAAGGVSAFPQSVTAQMVDNFHRGGAAINVLAKQAGAEVRVVDAGVAGDYAAAGKIPKVGVGRAGTADMTFEPAMSRADAEAVVESGVRFAEGTGVKGRFALVPGDMGIGNTTSAAAITACITGSAPSLVTGRGTGVDAAGFQRKVEAVERALALHGPDPSDGIGVLSAVGGFEIGFLAGLVIGAASRRGIVILDGYISTSAALIAATIEPRVVDFMFAGHRSVEPGHVVALSHLGLEPLFDLGMRLGEGTGGVLALTVVRAALAAHNGMATFDEAGVSEGPDGE